MPRKQPSPQTIKRLFSLSGNKCAFPKCNIQFTSSNSDSIVANICHIEAAEK
jgi:hypothetical protein